MKIILILILIPNILLAQIRSSDLFSSINYFSNLNKKQNNPLVCKMNYDSNSKPKICITPKASKCQGVFINKDCSPGIMGQKIKKLFKNSYLSKAGDSIPFQTMIYNPPNDILQACPRYNSLTDNIKENFWIWMMGVLAAQENECSKSYSGPNGEGTFQLEADNTSRTNLRPDVCSDKFIKKTYPGKSIQDIEPNTHCAMAILVTQISPQCKKCLNVKNTQLGSCVTNKIDKTENKKCESCRLCQPPSERREDLKNLSKGNLFPKTKGYFRHLNHSNEKQGGLNNESVASWISSFPYCNY